MLQITRSEKSETYSVNRVGHKNSGHALELFGEIVERDHVLFEDHETSEAALRCAELNRSRHSS